MALIHSLRCERLASNSQEINSIFDKNIKNVGKTFAGVEIVQSSKWREFHPPFSRNRA